MEVPVADAANTAAATTVNQARLLEWRIAGVGQARSDEAPPPAVGVLSEIPTPTTRGFATSPP